MNKESLINEISRECGITKKDVKSVIETLTAKIMSVVSENDNVSLVGFGKFYASERKAKDLTNPSTGERMHIDAYRAPAFKASASFKQLLK